MKLNILKLLSNNKLGLLIVLVISATFTYYVYSVEDKVEIYNTKISLPTQSDLYTAILINNLTSAKYIHNNDKGNCNVNLNTETSTYFDL